MMNRTELEKYILTTYGEKPDYPWFEYPDNVVFRHSSNKKWFTLIMSVPKNKLGLHEKDILDVVNVKCDPFMIGSLLNETGFFPAYHMNKENWITIALDGSVTGEKIKMLLDLSYNATISKVRKN